MDRIVVSGGRAAGVALRDGTVIEGGVVISNADPKRTFGTLVDRRGGLEEYGRSLAAMSTRAAYLKFHCALSELPDFSRYIGGRPDLDETALAQVRISPSIESFELSWRQARSGMPADEPVMHIQIPSVYDGSLVEGEGHHVMSVWALYAPVRPSRGTWDELRESVGERMIDTIGRYAPGFRDQVIDWSLFTPADLEERMYLTDGNIRHLDMVAGQMFSDRLGYETPIRGLYLCGAGTHPGGEVTGAPGHNAARVVLGALRRRARPERPATSLISRAWRGRRPPGCVLATAAPAGLGLVARGEAEQVEDDQEHVEYVQVEADAAHHGHL